MKRAKSIQNVLDEKHKLFDLSPEFESAFGSPQTTGVWMVWGSSGSGKTNFLMQLTKELSKHSKIIYNSLEEGGTATLQNTIKKANMQEVARRVVIVSESLEELEHRLEKSRGYNIIVVDSWQYTHQNFTKFKEMTRRFRNRLFIVNSHADGKQPAGRSAKRVKFDASLKIWVEGFKAFSMGRTIGDTGEYVIWDKGAAMYWGNAEVKDK